MTGKNSSFECVLCLERLDEPAPKPAGQQDTTITSMPGANRGNKQVAKAKKNEPGLDEVVTTKCGHLYHKVCLQEWLKKKSSHGKCPLCREKIPDKNGLIRVYPSCTSGLSSGQNDHTDNDSEPGNEEFSEEMDSMKKATHETLVKDHEALLKKYYKLKDNEEFKDAQIISLTEDNSKKDSEINSLKRKLEGSQSTSSTPEAGGDGEPSNKRRRLNGDGDAGGGGGTCQCQAQ